ncbi:sigma-70 family RNA polymerase sigma factor [Patulibacter minatonensis]|uniref:sigma-70 family RNA polymerase sigma factor n=1 Tax=Patulibacter minatonensis TaxID=298163 RepID=UPI0004BBA070|nr:sigma-70 family RNA polymerase sigma factor [Patulibacter minatonensis]
MSPLTTRQRPDRRPTSEQLLARWERYRATGSKQERDDLVFLLTPLVRHIVTRKIRQLPAYCEMDDLAAAGYEALVVSIERYDPVKGATLEQFAWTRIHGAVLDELRRRDWAPRSLRRWERDAEKARRELRGHLEREPTDVELADRLESTPDEVRGRRDQLALAEVESLATTVSGSDGVVVDRAETIAMRDRSMDPEHATAVKEARDRVAAAVAALPSREREVALLLYVEERRLREIGELLGVSESRVCQIAGTLRKRLRVALGGDAELLGSLVD